MDIREIKQEDLGKQINDSRSATIYDFGEGKVLKLFHKGFPDIISLRECKNTEEAYKKGATTMRFFETVKLDDRIGLVLEKINGVTQIEYFLKHFPYLFKAGVDLAHLQVKVHNIETDVMDDYTEICKGYLDLEQFSFLTEAQKANLIKYLDKLPKDNKIIHMDFHVNNVLMTENKEFVVIDWTTACKGSPLAELAMMHFLFTQAELFPGLSKFMVFVFNILKKILYNKFYKTYKKETGITKADFMPYRISALIFRFGTWAIESEAPKIQNELKEFADKYVG